MRALLITVLVLLGLLVAADFAGRALAESRAGEAIAGQTGGQVAPEVDIRGISFLAQALPGEYERVTITERDLTLGPLRGATVEVDLWDVTYPLSSALSGSTQEMVARRADLRATVPATVLSEHLDAVGLTLSSAPGGGARLSATLDILGTPVPVSADVSLSVTADTLTFAAGSVTAQGFSLPDPGALAQQLSLSVPLTGLPLTLQGAAVTVQDGALVVAATVDDLRVSEFGRAAVTG